MVCCSALYRILQGLSGRQPNADFRTKSDGKDYERRFLLQKSHDLTMNFEDFYYLYMSSMETRLRESTLCMKKAVIENKDPALLQKQTDVRHYAG